MKKARELTVNYAGQVYHIPQQWIIGACHGGKLTFWDAVRRWIEQDEYWQHGDKHDPTVR